MKTIYKKKKNAVRSNDNNTFAGILKYEKYEPIRKKEKRNNTQNNKTKTPASFRHCSENGPRPCREYRMTSPECNRSRATANRSEEDMFDFSNMFTTKKCLLNEKKKTRNFAKNQYITLCSVSARVYPKKLLIQTYGVNLKTKY